MLRNINQSEKFITLDIIEGPLITTEELKPLDEKIKSDLKKFGISHFLICTVMTHHSTDQESVSVLIGADYRDAMRFLWMHDDSNLLNLKVQIYRMCRVMFGAKFSPFLLSACIKHHLKKFESGYPKTVELLSNYMYVDDFICGTDTGREAIEQNETEKRRDSVSFCDSSAKVLGLEWNTHNDVFSFSAQDIIEFIEGNQQTKLYVLKADSKIFDLLVFLNPSEIQAKVLLKDLWLTAIDWDKPIPAELLSKWIKWYGQLKELQEVQITRWYSCTDVDTSHD
ncbi:hypothetical protein HNY73_014766 [Argiope bruennichi]|uniref:Reverse transcriptase domain-containing protein n=1 Tax=Argiope bruennichi TaxID=94029 RepID=A0A8T0EVC6_ARGBR|nr:hypothetical protein HNY73_014766 [Argiope bruennichi]